MSTTCKYCNEPENKQTRPGLICEACICFVHLTCLRRPGTPGDFTCDVFFDFTCEGCSPDKKEKFVRNKFQWVNVILLTLHHLSTQSYGISNNGFFHYKTHICSFIDRHWHLLFGMYYKQKKNWVGTIAGALSVYNNLFFKSGSAVLGETGWWRLQHKFSPAVAAHIIQEMARDKPKGRPRNQMAQDTYFIFLGKVNYMGYLDLVNEERECSVPAPAVEPATKKRRVDSDDSNVSYYDQFDSDSRAELGEQSAGAPAELPATDADVTVFRGFDYQSQYMPPSSSSSVQSAGASLAYCSSDSRSASPAPELQETPANDSGQRKKVTEEKTITKRESLFSAELNSVDMPWIEPPQETPKDLVEMTHYEEIQLLKQVEGLIPKVRDPNKKAYLHRLKAKLSLRRLKRHKHLPVFDLDKTVKLFGGYVPEEQRATDNIERVLDRFQRSYLLEHLSGTVPGLFSGAVLSGAGGAERARSLYSGAELRPYIRRATAAAPRLALMDELLVRTHRHIAGYRPPRAATLDYSYVRPQHIAAVNSLCAQYFWPGIDLTSALEYPEYSCVVSYRRLVVGCAFLVPDAGHNEAYISFVLTSAHWRGAGIATFMLYHLLQTCTGKDVTLHVSPTNPAIFLYQKFGFKVQELIQDFYEKYYDIDYKGCRHALLLRLVR